MAPNIWVFLTGWAIFQLILWRAKWLSRLAMDAVAVVDALMAGLPEEEKLKLVERRNVRLLGSLGLVLILLIAAGGMGWLLLWVGETSLDLKVTWGFMGWTAFSLGATLPFFFLSKSVGPYTPIQQLFHHLVLDSPHLGKALFKREVKRVSKGEIEKDQPFVIVTGLARAGTTALMNALYQTGKFASLNYAHMPLIMAPGTWSKWHKPKYKGSKERIHNDGIEVRLDSTEALEEYFFCAYDDYVQQSTLQEYTLTAEKAVDYSHYRSIVVAASGAEKRYLAKNNNALLRFASMVDHYPMMRMVVLFRHPLYHADSLMQIHERFTDEQAKDPFFLTYMNWLGHFEFGQNIKAFNWADGTSMPDKQPKTMDDWLERWMAYYERVLALRNNQMILIGYDTFCQSPNRVVGALLKELSMEIPESNHSSYINKRNLPSGASPEMAARAMELYHRLLKEENALTSEA
jgi:hypothetical protein